MPATDKTNILVVDDLPEKLLVYESILETLDARVVTARSGEDALRKVLDEDFAVILLDVNMPGMDGLETAAFIRRRKRSVHTPIIFITAYADDVHAARGYSLGAVDYILSPVVPEVLRTKVKVFVDLYRMHDRVRRQADERVEMAKEQAARAAAEESNRRLKFLAEASGVLSRSLDLDETVSGLGQVVVPFLSDLCAVCVLDEQSGSRRVWACWIEDSVEAGPRTLRCVDQELDLPLRQAVDLVLATGKPEWLAEIAPARGSRPEENGPDEKGRSAEQTGSVSRFATSSAIVVPLAVRGRVLGAMALAYGSGRRHGPDYISLFEDLAARAAVAVENARLYRSIRDADHQKDEFLAMLAHELRNPLAPICNAIEILRLRDLNQPDLVWARSVIERQVNHLVRLVDDLLDVSRITRGKIALRKQHTDVAAIIASAEEASRPIIHARRHQLLISLPPEPLELDVDPDRICQVLNNLLNNAAKYTEPGGHIWFNVSAEEGEAVFRIRDSGIGISKDMLPRVFDLFTQIDQSLDRHAGGLGIGLPLVRKLVEMHGGTVQGFSAGQGQGSEFVVKLPLPEPRPVASHKPQEAPGQPVESTSRRVLVVDDHEDVAECLAMLLKDLGHTVWTVYDGVSAFEAVRTFSPEVVLLDLGLPEMDGYEVARRLRAEHGRENLLLVALTGYGQEEDRRRTVEAGFDEHLLKPAGCAELNRLLAHAPLQQ